LSPVEPMIAHITTSMQTLLTIRLVQVANTFNIASCLLVYILNKNIKTRYSNTWIKPQQYKKLQRYLKQWKFMLAHLNRNIDIFLKTNYMVSAYHIKTTHMETIWPQEKAESIHSKNSMPQIQSPMCKS